MNQANKMELVMEAIRRAQEEGKELTLGQAEKKLHRDYITDQLWELGMKPPGFLVAAGMFEIDKDDKKVADHNLLSLFYNYLASESKLTGERGMKIREAMDRFGIDYTKSPTFPLEPLDAKSA